ncbi:MAG: hypothetical protein A2063_11065 [Gallionellales bacterium GWA2_60_142]|nr:MAG: hypothetical protein A2063_11065 [Gallionellales bacterium GWA2_60_142]HCI12902.1 hypothetical protein [Gallionellaceae bacterium]
MHVAGIAQGQNGTTRGQPAHGIARGAKVTAINVFTYDGATNSLIATQEDFITALTTVANLTPWNSINTVNISLAYPGVYLSSCSAVLPSFAWPIDLLRDKNMVVVSAVGNDAAQGFRPPACAGAGVKAMAMDSINNPGTMAGFTNYANPANFAGPTFVAPGVDICSSVIGGGMACWNGTSMAAPHVAGAYAVLKAALPGYYSYDFTAWLQSVAVNMTHPSLPGVTFKRIRLP